VVFLRLVADASYTEIVTDQHHFAVNGKRPYLQGRCPGVCNLKLKAIVMAIAAAAAAYDHKSASNCQLQCQ